MELESYAAEYEEGQASAGNVSGDAEETLDTDAKRYFWIHQVRQVRGSHYDNAPVEVLISIVEAAVAARALEGVPIRGPVPADLPDAVECLRTRGAWLALLRSSGTRMNSDQARRVIRMSCSLPDEWQRTQAFALDLLSRNYLPSYN